MLCKSFSHELLASREYIALEEIKLLLQGLKIYINTFMYLAGNPVKSTVEVRSANNHTIPSSTVSAQLSINSMHSRN